DRVSHDLPEVLSREFQRLASEASQQILSVASKCWATALAESASGVLEENVKLRKQIEGLEKEMIGSSDRPAQVESQRDERDHALDQHIKEKADLQSALRNAESDLRAAQRMIDTFERNRREDRDDIRDLQKRIEGLVG